MSKIFKIFSKRNRDEVSPTNTQEGNTAKRKMAHPIRKSQSVPTNLEDDLDADESEISKNNIEDLFKSGSNRITLEIVTSKSSVWKEFERLLLDGKYTGFVSCKKCKTVLTHKANSGTSGLRFHKCQNLSAKTSTVGSSSGNKTENQTKMEMYISKAPDKINKIKADIANSTVIFVSKDLRPLSILEGEGFKNLGQTLINIGAKYVTIQYFANDRLFARVLQTRAAEDKTGKTTYRETIGILREFEISDKLLFFVTDNTASMPKGFRGQLWFGCMAHLLNLVQQKSFDLSKIPDEREKITLAPISDLIEYASKMVTYCKKSNLRNVLDTMLKQSVETRWDSKYDMLVSIRENHDNLMNESTNNEKLLEFLNFIQLDELEILINILRPLKQARMKLCCDLKPTFHWVWPVKMSLLEEYSDKTDDFDWVRIIKRQICRYIYKYMLISAEHKWATLLFPPLKSLTKLATDEEKQEIIGNLRLRLLNEATDSPSETTKKTQDPPFEINIDPLLKMFSDISTSTTTTDQNELDSYLSSPFERSVLTLPVEQFWIINRSIYPKLSKIAFQLLSIPATNLSSERNFNYAGLTVTDKRSKLSPKNVDKLLFIRSNYELL